MNEEIKKLFVDLFEEDELEEINTELAILKSGDVEKSEKIADDAVKAIKDSLDTLNDYKENMPSDVLEAVKMLTKYASYGYPIKRTDEEIKKAGAKLSKSTKDQIIKVLSILKESPKRDEAIEILKGLIGQDVKKLDDKKIDDEKISPEIQAQLDKLADYEKKEKEAIEKAAKEEKEKKEKEIEDIKEEIELMKKEKGIKTSIDDPEKDKDKKIEKDEEVDPLPSIPTPVINRSE